MAQITIPNKFEGAHILVEVDDLYNGHLQGRWLSLYRINQGKVRQDYSIDNYSITDPQAAAQ